MIREQYVKDKFAQIQEAFKRIERFKSTGDAKIVLDLESYLVVLISGAYEDSLEYLIKKRAGKAGDKEISAFVEKTLEADFRNPNWESLTNILKRFSRKWVDTMNKKIRNEAKVGLNNIVINKNAVSHGNINNLTFGEIKKCHKDCKCIFEKLEKIM
ncbi:MAG: HEPN domain-containing protein [Dehalococcoidales bacterium]|jgi:hypothetical protein